MVVSERPPIASKPPVRVRHPIGAGASPFEDQLTEVNREALSQCLHLYYHDALEPRNTPLYGEFSTGRAKGYGLGARITSLLEIGNALAELERKRLDLWQIVDRYYGDDVPKQDIERERHLRHGEAAKRIDEALNFMLGVVFYDEDARGG